MTPAQSILGEMQAELPLGMLNASNNNPQHLEVLYRTSQNIWGVPHLKEFPSAVFNDLADTLGYHYKKYLIDNIKTLSTLRFAYNFSFSQSAYFMSNENDSTQRYFQLMLNVKDALGLGVDSSSKQVMFAVDLSGDQDKSRTILQTNLQLLMKSALKQTDKFNIMAAGCGRIIKMYPAFLPADTANISAAISSLINSTFFDSISQLKKKNLLFADGAAVVEWGFTGIDSVANIKNYIWIVDANPYISASSIVASYEHGFELIPNDQQLAKIIPAIDSLFLNGGRFLAYYDISRDPYERIATHYITGLKTLKNIHENTTLYRNSSGNIGLDFPESVDHAGTYFLQYNDPDVKIELQDLAGEPTVISKRIGRGLLVVSGLWEFNDDAGLKKMLNIPLLGLTRTSGYQQLVQLYNAVKSEYQSEAFQKVIIISNGDSLMVNPGANNWADEYITSFGGSKPVFSSVNLLTGSMFLPATTTYNGNVYYGSGLLMNLISEKSGGVHFESYNNNIFTICSGLNPYSITAIGPLQFTVKADNSTQLITDFFEIKLVPTIPTNPHMFIGSTTGIANVQFDLSARVLQNDSLLTWSMTYPLSHDTSKGEAIISSMIGNEKIKTLFSVIPVDTARIVSLAIRHNLLCDFTAMLALEPNDTIHFMKNPFDESGLLSVSDKIQKDSVSCSVFPNPFNLSTRIMVNLPNMSKLKVEIYDILGRRVQIITDAEELKGLRTYSWNGRNSFGSTVSTGVYLVHVIINDKVTSKQTMLTKKIIMLK
jgi:hypothetical protein